MAGPYFVFGGPGEPLAFPTIGGQPALIPQAEFEACCCAPPTFFTIDLGVEFPPGPLVGYGERYGAKTFGPYASTRFVYSHADDPAGADDDLVINGAIIDRDDLAEGIFDGATTLLLRLPAGDTFTVDIHNSVIYGGFAYGTGRLRLYNKRLRPGE